MFGVVLWSSKEERKAVIWCEDHGDLAFYNGVGGSAFDGDPLDAGDLVCFDISEGRDMRVATDPQLVAEQQYAGVVENLMSDDAPRADGRPSRGANTQIADGDNVIAFVPRHCATRKAS